MAVALALCAVADLELEPLELALACQRAELRAVGVPCGILDQAACVLAEEGAAVLLDCWTLEYRLVRMPLEAVLLIVDSGVERSLEDTAYAARRAELEGALRTSAPSARPWSRSPTSSGLDGFRSVDCATWSPRTIESASSRPRSKSGDLASAGALLFASHESLRDDYEVSIPELDLLVSLAESAGAYGARLLGAGFGGSVLVLVDRERADAVAREIADRHRPRAGNARRTMVVHASPGAAIRHG